MKSQTITLSNSQTLFYIEQGSQYINQKPTLLFVHGNFSSSYWWLDVMEQLSQYEYHVVAVDLRGFGNSTYNTACGYFGDWAVDLKLFCLDKNIKQCIAIGWSFGGGVSMKFAEIAPQIVCKLVLTCSVSHLGLILSNKQQKCLSRQQILQNPKTKFMLELMASKNKQAMGQIWQSLLFTHSKDYPANKKDKMLQICFQQRCYVDLLHALANSDIKLQQIKAEGFMVHGAKDLVITLESVKETGAYFKNFHILDNNAHMIPIENQEEYVELITAFINKK